MSTAITTAFTVGTRVRLLNAKYQGEYAEAGDTGTVVKNMGVPQGIGALMTAMAGLPVDEEQLFVAIDGKRHPLADATDEGAERDREELEAQGIDPSVFSVFGSQLEVIED